MDGQALVETIDQLQRRLAAETGATVGFVPTMGALHEGHFSLVRRARQECDLVVVSIFVNPLQFGPGEDLAAYPRRLGDDEVAARAAGADIVFAPTEQEIYPGPPLTKVSVDKLDGALCGRYRPGHFTGVATIVVKLLNMVRPDRAYFGEKDWQQLVIVKKAVDDLNMGVAIVGVPVVRDSDGLALSSRNLRLSAEERRAALALPAAVRVAAEAIEGGERDAGRVLEAAKEVIAGEPGVKLEYFSVCRPDDFIDIKKIEGEVLVAAAVYVGKTRLIDNMVIKV